MQETTTWKGHSFTLMVFTGIVVLCSIFFVLGMMVGRTQSLKASSTASAPSEPAAPALQPEVPSPATERPEPAPARVEAQARDRSTPAFEPLTPRPDPEKSAPAPSKATASPPPSAPPPALRAKPSYYQVGALKLTGEAERLVTELRGKGFAAFIVAPAPGDPNPLYRVQVGPFESAADAMDIRVRLEAAGYKDILRR